VEVEVELHQMIVGADEKEQEQDDAMLLGRSGVELLRAGGGGGAAVVMLRAGGGGTLQAGSAGPGEHLGSTSAARMLLEVGRLGGVVATPLREVGIASKRGSTSGGGATPDDHGGEGGGAGAEDAKLLGRPGSGGGPSYLAQSAFWVAAVEKEPVHRGLVVLASSVTGQRVLLRLV